MTLSLFQLANYIEAGVWIAMGLGLMAYRLSTRPPRRIERLPLLAVTLIAFGISDIIEAGTGAWYRPVWLLVWKAVCVIILLGVIAERVVRNGRVRP